MADVNRNLKNGAIRTQREVQRILAERGEKISRARVFQLEQRAMAKLKRGLAELAVEFGLIDEVDDA